MSERAKTVCIACGLAIGEPPVLNSLPSGRPCGACRERVFESLPPLLPARSSPLRAIEEHERSLDPGLDASAFLEDPRLDPPA
jgi:hypothetical protein